MAVEVGVGVGVAVVVGVGVAEDTVKAITGQLLAAGVGVGDGDVDSSAALGALSGALGATDSCLS